MQGVYSVLPTPFAPDGSFDSPSLGRVIDLFLEDGVSGFTALGVTSEVARISDRERDEILDASMAHADGRAPVNAASGGARAGGVSGAAAGPRGRSRAAGERRHD